VFVTAGYSFMVDPTIIEIARREEAQVLPDVNAKTEMA
jgi:hypothetical protein